MVRTSGNKRSNFINFGQIIRKPLAWKAKKLISTWVTQDIIYISWVLLVKHLCYMK